MAKNFSVVLDLARGQWYLAVYQVSESSLPQQVGQAKTRIPLLGPWGSVARVSWGRMAREDGRENMPSIRDFRVMSHGEALQFLGLRDLRKIGHNTYVHPSRREAGAVGITYHSTEIITIHVDNTYTLRTNGWLTPTTKLRLNKCSPARVWAHRGEWFIGDGHEYAEGMRVDRYGEPCAIIPC